MEMWMGAAHSGYCRDSSLFHSISVPVSAESVEPFLPAIRNPYPEILRGGFYDSDVRFLFVNWVIISVEEGGKLRIQSQGLWLTDTGTYS